MKPFSKFEAIGEGKPVVTRDGLKVTQLKEFELSGPYQVVGVVEGKESTSTWTDDGIYCLEGIAGNMDLFMASVTKEGWVAFGAEENQVSHGLVGFATHVWPTEEEAVSSYKVANEGREPKGTAKISWEE